jgi:hypothetical protein
LRLDFETFTLDGPVDETAGGACPSGSFSVTVCKQFRAPTGKLLFTWYVILKSNLGLACENKYYLVNNLMTTWYQIIKVSNIWYLVVIKLFTKKYLRTKRQQMISLGLSKNQLSGRGSPDRKGLIKIISTRYFLVIKEIKKISSRYDFDQYFRSGHHVRT